MMGKMKMTPELAALVREAAALSRERERLEDEHKRTINDLRQRQRVLRRKLIEARGHRLPEPRRSEDLDPHQQAGYANVEAMRDVFSRGRRLSQAEAGKRAGVGTGSSTWAIRALLKEGAIREVGVDGRSRVFAYVPKAQRVTTVRPGQ